jgi:hypothetical protein
MKTKKPLNGLGSLVSLDANAPDGPKHHLCVKCGGDAAEVIPICTREVKSKRPRTSYHAWPARPCPTPDVVVPAADAAIVAAPAVAAIVVDAAAVPAVVVPIPFSYSVSP